MSRRQWSPEALALFAEYRDRREPHRPLTCDDGERCWVRDGPPSMGGGYTRQNCVGCGGPPRTPVGSFKLDEARRVANRERSRQHRQRKKQGIVLRPRKEPPPTTAEQNRGGANGPL
jgi:hypothetical protein